MSTIKDVVKANAKDKSLQKNAWYSNHVARPISLLITKPFTYLEPTTVCFTMILVGLFSIPFFAYGSYTSIILGAIILQIHYILDHVDGNVARLMNKKTLRGKYLDFVPNILVNPLVLIALGYGGFRQTGDVDFLLFGISAGFFFTAIEPARLFRYLMIFEDGIKTKPSNRATVSRTGVLNRYLSSILNYPGIMNLILILSLFGLAPYLVFLYGLVFPLLFIARAGYEFFRWKSIDNGRA